MLPCGFCFHSFTSTTRAAMSPFLLTPGGRNLAVLDAAKGGRAATFEGAQGCRHPWAAGVQVTLGEIPSPVPRLSLANHTLQCKQTVKQARLTPFLIVVENYEAGRR